MKMHELPGDPGIQQKSKRPVAARGVVRVALRGTEQGAPGSQRRWEDGRV